MEAEERCCVLVYIDLGVRLVPDRELVGERFDLESRPEEEEVGREEVCERTPSEKPESWRSIFGDSSLGEGEGSGSIADAGFCEGIFCSGARWGLIPED
jgi:hypothetical protein